MTTTSLLSATLTRLLKNDFIVPYQMYKNILIFTMLSSTSMLSPLSVLSAMRPLSVLSAMRPLVAAFRAKRPLGPIMSLSRRTSTHPNVEKNTVTDISEFPPQKVNTVVNFGRQGSKYVVERFGKFQTVHPSGVFFTVPFIDRIMEIDTRQMVIDVDRQHAYTGDNVAVSVAAQLYITVVDVESACYKVSQPLVAVVSQAQSALRTAIGKNDLDHLLKDRNSINHDVGEALKHSVEQWGINVSRFEITELTPDLRIQQAMDLQSTAERERRAAVTSAEGHKKAMELQAEGKRQAAILEAEGKKIAMELEAEGIRNASALIGEIMPDIREYQLQRQHIDMMGSMAAHGKHSTYFVPRDMSALPAWSDVFLKK
jgi:regulator of protease activity HflC (stomatin/prohibitin superfamily)